MARRHRRHSSVASSAVSSAMSSRYPSRAASPSPPQKPFRFFDLPSELRLRIYEEALHVKDPIDLDALNYSRIRPRLALFLVCRRMHDEAYHVFYAQTIRLFPFSAGRFFHTKKPLLQRLSIRYREAITSVFLQIGPGFSDPPRCQNTNPSLGLMDCINLRTLKILVECDPSDPVFAGFRGKGKTEDTYKWFCVDLLTGIFDQVPSLETVEIDAWPSVKKDGPLVSALVRKTLEGKKKLAFGPLRCWEKDDEPGLVGLETAIASMSISNEAPRTMAVQA